MMRRGLGSTLLLVGAGMALLASCATAERTPEAAGKSSAAPSGAASKVCDDVARVRLVTPAILDRLASGTESVAQYTGDLPVIDAASQALYTDASAFAYQQGSHIFEHSNTLSIHLNNLIYGYFMFTEPAQVSADDVRAVRDDLARIDATLASGGISCVDGREAISVTSPPSDLVKPRAVR